MGKLVGLKFLIEKDDEEQFEELIHYIKCEGFNFSVHGWKNKSTDPIVDED